MPKAIPRTGALPSKDDWKLRIGSKVCLKEWYYQQGKVKLPQPLDWKSEARAIDGCESEILRVEGLDQTKAVREDIDRTDDELFTDLERKCQEDMEQAQLADARWALQQWAADSPGFSKNEEGDYVAVLDRQVLGHGNRPNELRQHWADKKKVPFSRICVMFIGNEEVT
ncbi:MAG TPA: hypothetical protein VHR66_23105 [Gemmataceae bacterium]|nr:hypothetical protein [Gemmataceae bacterium]